MRAVEDYAIFMLDPTGDVISWNEGAERIKRYTEDDIVGEHFSEFYTDADIDEGVPEENLDTAAAEGRAEDEGWRVRKDGSRFWANVVITAIRDDDGTLQGFTKVTRDRTEQREYERQLRQERDLTEQIFETSPTGILVVDAAGEITHTNDRAEDLLGRPVENLTELFLDTGERTLGPPTDNPMLELESVVEQVRTTGDAVFDVEVNLERSDGHSVWLSINAAPLNNASTDSTETIVTLEDITDRKQLTAALTRLNTTSRELMEVDAENIPARAAELTQDVLDVASASLWAYDGETGELHRQTRTTTSGIDPDDIQYPDGFKERTWQVFISDDKEVDNDLPPAVDSGPTASPIQSEAIVPLGRHGIIYAGSRQSNTFDATTVDLAETVAATVETALDRAAADQQLEAQNTKLTRLNQINTIIREIDQGLVQADTREEIDRIVCDRLAASDRFEFAWIGEIEPGTDTVTPREWAGVDPGYLDALEITTDETETGRGPVGTALRTRDQQVVKDIVTDARFVPWREETLERGVRSCISVPLGYEDSLYGVLTVYVAQPLNDTGYEVLGELGETIGHAINAVETKRTLQTDSVVELSLQLHEPDTVLWRLAQQAACTIEVEGLVPHADEPPTFFVTVDGASADEIQRQSTDSISIESVTCLTESEDGFRCKAVIGGTTLASAIIAEEALIRSLTIEESAVTAVVDLSQTSDVRPFVESIRSQFPSTDLVARRTRNRSLASEQNVQTAVAERLTDRQQEVLRTAYLSGFFEMPRENTGQEIADFLDVSPPTFTQHLRRGQHSLFELLFDGV